ncbi:hypothetical protein FRC01_009882 [Tulasnella sp. 417]|nr:hypothetical protein FRC01_009882 [Tulasnella sp. 417]
MDETAIIEYDVLSAQKQRNELFALILSLVAAAALPDVVPRNETFSKRGGENYLANCERGNQYNAYDNYPASYVTWYSNVNNSQDGQRPDSLSSEYRNWAAGGDYLHWEGQEQDIYFPDSGVTVQTHIDSNAQSRGLAITPGTPTVPPTERLSTATKYAMILSV